MVVNSTQGVEFNSGRRLKSAIPLHKVPCIYLFKLGHHLLLVSINIYAKILCLEPGSLKSIYLNFTLKINTYLYTKYLFKKNSWLIFMIFSFCLDFQDKVEKQSKKLFLKATYETF